MIFVNFIINNMTLKRKNNLSEFGKLRKKLKGGLVQ